MLESIKKLREGVWNGHKVTRIKPSTLLIYLDAIEREIAERFMRLPVDADGVPIHIGDRITCKFNGDYNSFSVYALETNGNDS